MRMPPEQVFPVQRTVFSRIAVVFFLPIYYNKSGRLQAAAALPAGIQNGNSDLVKEELL